MSVELVTIDPGHFHAALIQKQVLPGVSSRAHVYAPLGPDLLAHLQRVHGFNARPDHPTGWELEIHACADFLDRFRRERPGTVAILSGRNRRKIDYLEAALDAGLNVLADKPWVIVPEDLPRLRRVLETARTRGLIAYDIMTERWEITNLLCRLLVNEADVFGRILPGSADAPAVFMESVHYLLKNVAGVPLRRPVWFFDVNEAGEGLADVGTHLVDLISWTLLPDRVFDPQVDLALLQAKRWPTNLSQPAFERITGESRFPTSEQPAAGQFPYFCNTELWYTLRGVHAHLRILWDLEAQSGALDTHYASFRGSQSRIEVRQGAEEKFRPELFVVPNQTKDIPAHEKKLRQLLKAWERNWPGLDLESRSAEIRITIPDRYRVGHEPHFTQVAEEFLGFLKGTKKLPDWEESHMLGKYLVTTEGVALARQHR